MNAFAVNTVANPSFTAGAAINWFGDVGKSVYNSAADFGEYLINIPPDAPVPAGPFVAVPRATVKSTSADVAGTVLTMMIRVVGDESTAARGGVYVLRDAEGVIMRSGRTSDLARRALEHGRDRELGKFFFDTIRRTDVYSEQRGLEQLLHDAHNPPLNKIRPIGPNNPNLEYYLNAAKDFINRLLGK